MVRRQSDGIGFDMTFRQHLGIVEAIAREAGDAAMRFYGSATAQAKGDQSPVTAADHAANDIIVEGLAKAFPHDAILSEESRDSAARLSIQRVWIVDPLDGTKEFLAQNGEFAVMIGLAVEGKAVLGVVYLPATEVLYSGAQGLGTWVQRGGQRERLQCAPRGRSPLRLVGSRSHADPLLERMQHALSITDVVPCGSVGVKCSRIMEGQRDLYVHPVPYLKEWDTCAPEVLLREAGGIVTDCCGEALRYNKLDPVQPHGIFARGPGLEDVLFDTVTTMYHEEMVGPAAVESALSG